MPNALFGRFKAPHWLDCKLAVTIPATCTIRRQKVPSVPNSNFAAIEARLIELRQEHRDLDLAIASLIEKPIHDELQLKRMKKRKLLLKDQVAFLESQLHPDQLA